MLVRVGGGYMALKEYLAKHPNLFIMKKADSPKEIKEEPEPPKRWTAVAPKPKPVVKPQPKAKPAPKALKPKIDPVEDPEPLVCAEGHELVDNSEMIKEMLSEDFHKTFGKKMQFCVSEAEIICNLCKRWVRVEE